MVKYEILEHNNNKIQVESAVRDGNGVKIDTNYALLSVVQSQISTAVQGVLNTLYPVGSIYMNVSNSTNPGTLLGFGTWQELAPGRVLMGAGTGTDSNNVSQTYTAGATTGEYNHTLTTTELASHGHSVSVNSTDITHAHYYTPSGSISNTNLRHRHGINVRDDQADGRNYHKYGRDYGDSTTLYTDYQLGNHNHTFTGSREKTEDAGGSHGHTVDQSNAGGDTAHNNVQPSLVVYMWKRTA